MISHTRVHFLQAFSTFERSEAFSGGPCAFPGNTHTHTHTHTHARTHARTHTHTHTFACAIACAHVRTHAHTHTHTHTHCYKDSLTCKYVHDHSQRNKRSKSKIIRKILAVSFQVRYWLFHLIKDENVKQRMSTSSDMWWETFITLIKGENALTRRL